MVSKSHFWNCCPKLLEFLPEKHCDLGKPTKDKNNRITKNPQCDWWINSKKHNYCFWKYIYDNSSPDGSMKEIPQPELARLFGCSNTKAYFMIKDAIQELKELLENQEVMNDLKIDLNSQEGVNIKSLLNSVLNARNEKE